MKRAQNNNFKDRFCSFVAAGRTCLLLTIVALGICVYDGFQDALCLEDPTIMSVFWSCVVNMSYGFVSAAIFYFVVNYCPFMMREKALAPYLHHKMYHLRELLRLCKMSVVSPFDLNTANYDGTSKPFREDESDRERYVEIFEGKNLCENYEFSKTKSILDALEGFRGEIDRIISDLLQYQEYMSSEDFAFVVEVAKSYFMCSSIVPNSERVTTSDANQKEMGECIFDLYEKARLWHSDCSSGPEDGQ